MRKAKGFTLFTALVSFILIILASMLITAMIKSERNTTEIIADIREQMEMQAVADLTRADALQVFNYGVRYRIEDWLTNPENIYLMTPDKSQWNEIVTDFAISNFGGEIDPLTGKTKGEQFATLTANHLTNILGAGAVQQYGSYELELESDSELLKNSLQQVFIDSIAGGDFFQVIDCDGTFDGCKKGTFYVNMNMEDLSPAEYEALPQIVVTNLSTGRVLKEPILPKGNFRIYVPLRIFKALAAAREITQTTDKELDSSNYGLFSARIHNELEEMRLGLCDPYNCAPRTNPYTAPSTAVIQNSYCPGDTRAGYGKIDSVQASVSALTGFLGTTEVEYNPDPGYPSGQKAMNSALKELVRARVAFVLNKIIEDKKIPAGSGADFVLAAEYFIRPEVFSQKSKIIEITGEAGSHTITGTAMYSANRPLSSGACPMANGGIGLFADQGKYKAVQLGSADTSFIFAGENYASCTELTTLGVELSFEDSDTEYMVSSSRGKNTYKVKLLDNRFTEFTPKYFAGYGSYCALEGQPWLQTVDETAWTCISREEHEELGVVAAKGCYPK